MRARIRPGHALAGEATVPGDKSIAHRWLILAATARGTSRLSNLPLSLDVRSTAGCLAAMTPSAGPSLQGWIDHVRTPMDSDGRGGPEPTADLVVPGAGRRTLEQPRGPLDCGNSGTTMRLLAGIVAAAPFPTVLDGDPSLRARPMERVAEPLRAMGATVRTDAGRPPMEVRGGALRGIRYELPVPSAQVKSAVLLAGTAAEGPTTVVEAVATRDHTERALEALGAPIGTSAGEVTVEAFQHEGFEGRVPGDVSSAAFLVAAAILTGSPLVLRGVGLNPSRIGFLDVLARMGAAVGVTVEHASMGEPVGTIEVPADAIAGGLRGTSIDPGEVAGIVDEVPVLAVLAATARGESIFGGLGELRVKESDRLAGMVDGIRGLGGLAATGSDDTLVIGGGGLSGGAADSAGDHRMAMAFTVAALAAAGPSVVTGVEAADVSFPGFFHTLAGLGAAAELEPGERG